MSDQIRALLSEQQRRLVATVMSTVEPAIRPRVSQGEWASIRRRLMDAIGSYHDLVLDAMRVRDTGVLRNDAVAEVLAALHRIEQAVAEPD